MGLTDSPYRSLQILIKAKYIAHGDRHLHSNPFQWSEAILNLPGSAKYDPMMIWVYKMRLDGNLACEIYVYVDDGRLTGFCKLECWRTTRRVCAIYNTLGMHHSARKRTEPSYGTVKYPPYAWRVIRGPS